MNQIDQSIPHTEPDVAARKTESAAETPSRPRWQELAQSVALNVQTAARHATAWLKRSGAMVKQRLNERRASKPEAAPLSAPEPGRQSRETRDAIDRAANEGMLP